MPYRPVVSTNRGTEQLLEATRVKRSLCDGYHALRQRILDRFPELRLQASGGVRNVRDLEELRESGVPAAITGRALLEGAITTEEMVAFRQNA